MISQGRVALADYEAVYVGADGVERQVPWGVDAGGC